MIKNWISKELEVVKRILLKEESKGIVSIKTCKFILDGAEMTEEVMGNEAGEDNGSDALWF